MIIYYLLLIDPQELVQSYYEDDFVDLGVADCSLWLVFVLSFEYLLQQLTDSIFYIQYLSSFNDTHSRRFFDV